MYHLVLTVRTDRPRPPRVSAPDFSCHTLLAGPAVWLLIFAAYRDLICLKKSQKDALAMHDMGMANSKQQNQGPGLERSTSRTRRPQQQLIREKENGDLVTHGTVLSPDI